MKVLRFFLFLLGLFIISATGFPFITIVPLVVSGVQILYNKLEDINCVLTECCRDALSLDLEGLSDSFRKKLFGQKAAAERILFNIKAHIEEVNPKKALVLTLHGSTGTGKGLSSEIIYSSLYKLGDKSNYIKKYDATVDFLDPEKIVQYKENLISDIEKTLNKCPRSLFVFDEVDKFPRELLDALVPFIGYSGDVHGVDPRKAIFLLLGNSAAREISLYLYDLIKKGGDRDTINYKDLNNILITSSYNEKGGLEMTELFKKSLVTASIPFLPLERKQVIQCIKKESEIRGYSISHETIDEIISELEWFPKEVELFSSAGCKLIFEKVGYYYHLHRGNDEL